MAAQLCPRVPQGEEIAARGEHPSSLVGPSLQDFQRAGHSLGEGT
jgi:hypothetical protein